MVTNFPAAPDLPPASAAAFRAMQAAIQALEVDKLSLQSQLSAANAAINRGRQPSTLQQPDLVNANVLIGDAPTLYVEPYAYFTRSGDTQGGLNVSWDYRSPTGELLNGPSEQFEVWVREVRVASDYPAFADMRVDPPPTGDSYMALSTQSMYGVVVRLDILTTYAVKVRSITSLGVPGNFSDEVVVTTPKEPRIRPIDPPFLFDFGGGVDVSWDWTQYFDPGTPPLYPDLTGFNATAVPVSATGETVVQSVVAPNGKVYVFLDPSNTRSRIIQVVRTDGSVYVIDSTPAYETAGGLAHNLSFAVGHDGNLYSVTNHFGNQLTNVTSPVTFPNPWEVVWKIDTMSDTLVALTARAAYASTNSMGYSSVDPIKEQNSGSGIIWPIWNNSTSQLGYRILDTSSLAFSEVVFTNSTYNAFGTRLVYLGAGKYVQSVKNTSSGNWEYVVFDVGSSTHTFTAYSGAPASNTVAPNLFGSSSPSTFYALGSTKVYSIDTATGLSTQISSGTSRLVNAVVTPSGLVVGAFNTPISGGTENGLTTINASTQYQYDVYVDATSSGTYGPVQSTIPINPLTGDLHLIWASPYSKPIYSYGSNRIYVQSSLGITILDAVLVSGDPGTPSFALNPETPWPEIKYVVAQRLDLAGWDDIGTYLGPGTISDPQPPGTYSYRLVAVSNTGQRGTPTAYSTITLV